MTSRTSWKLAWIAVVLVAVVLRLLVLADAREPFDDSYITLRYAWNVAHHGRWFFNVPGEKAQGATSLLWVLALIPASLFLKSGDPHAYGALVASSLVVQLATVFFLVRESARNVVRRRELTIGALLVAVAPTVVDQAASGMEASLAIALVTVVWARPPGGLSWCLALGLLPVTRPETAVTLVLPLGIALLIAERGRAPVDAPQRWLRAAGITLVPGLATLAVVSALRGWGNPFPTTLQAKNHTYDMLADAPPLHDYLLRGYSLTGLAVSVGPAWLGAALLIGMAALVAHVIVTRREPIITGWGFAWVANTLFYGAAIRWYFPWYSAVCAAISLWFVCATLDGLTVPRMVRATAAVAVFVLLVDAAKLRHVILGRATHLSWNAPHIGEALREMAPSDADIMLEPVGIIGFFSGLRVHDTVGLVSSDVTEGRAAPDCWYDRAVQRLHPEYIALREEEIDRNRDFLSDFKRVLACDGAPIPKGYSRALPKSSDPPESHPIALLRRNR
jgi:hypothetical protein